MSLTHQATGAVTSGTGLTVTATVPTTTTTGRLLMWVLFHGDVTALTNSAAPSGWTDVLGGPLLVTGVGAYQIYRKTGVVGDSATTPSKTYGSLTGLTQWQSVILVYDNYDASYAGTWTTAAASGTMSTTSLVSGTLTVPQANGSLLHLAIDNVNSTLSGTINERVDNGNATSASTVGVYDEDAPASGATTARTITSGASTSAWAIRTVWMPGLTAATATLTQSTFRGRNDDGTETTATWKATAGTDWTQLVDTNFRVRFNINDSVAAATQNTAFILRYSLNGGAYTAVSASSSVVRASASANVADGAATTEQLAGAGTFNTGTFDEVDGSATGFTAATATGQDTEVEYSVQIRGVDVADGDTINLRVYDNAGAALNGGYTDTPIITVSKPAVVPSEVYRVLQPVEFY